MDIEQIRQMTKDSNKGWGYQHVHRVLTLADCIDDGAAYDREAFEYAAWLHDWGAYPPYAQPGVEHAQRSFEVARDEILPQTHLSTEQKAVVLEAIELHDYRDPRPVSSFEALLLREADFLDFLGAIGIAREFARGPKDLPEIRARVAKRMEALRSRFTLPKAQRMAEERLAVMERYLELLDEDSFGYL
jgi:uncharacterized protein